MNNIYGFILSIFYVVLIILSGKVFEKAGKEASRKFIHIMLANWWIIALVFFDKWWTAALLPFIMIFVNYFSYKYDIIKVMERDEGEEEKESMGTVFYAVSLFILAVFSFGILKNPVIGLVGVVIMGYGDGLAAVIGQAVKSPEYKIKGHTKTLAGSFTMLCISGVIMAGFLQYNMASYIVVKSILSAIILTTAEAVSIKGYDNLTVPILASLLAMILV